MVTRSFSSRVFALTAAYALALQALLLSMTPAAPLAANARANLPVLCTTAGLDQPAGQDHPPCAPDCLMAGCLHAGAAPQFGAIPVDYVQSEIRISRLKSFWPGSRAIAKTPQIPRAPPLA